MSKSDRDFTVQQLALLNPEDSFQLEPADHQLVVDNLKHRFSANIDPG